MQNSEIADTFRPLQNADIICTRSGRYRQKEIAALPKKYRYCIVTGFAIAKQKKTRMTAYPITA
ncbi:MAG: hypothetical protein MJZ19_04640 [Paludibacteraceae bacterium]|nr:hypothetical protein [Paludibacteraceae bacterium]